MAATDSFLTTSALTDLTLWAREQADILRKGFIESPTLDQSCKVIYGLDADTVYTNVDLPYEFVGSAPGCDSDGTGTNIASRQIKFEPTPVGFTNWLCTSELKGIFKAARGKGNETLNAQEMGYFDYLMNLYEERFPMELLRMAWMSDSEAAHYNASTPGYFTNTLDLNLYNKFDGFWKLIYTDTITDGNTERRVEITQNTATVQSLSTSQAYQYMIDMYNAMSLEMLQDPNVTLKVTQSVYSLYSFYLTEKGVDQSFQYLQMGPNGLTFHGIPVVAVPEWDRSIKSAMNDSGTFYQPYRMLLANKDYFGFAFREEATDLAIDMEYIPVKRSTRIDTYTEVDAKILIKDYVAAF